jgi:hypothetical protein
VFLPTLGDIQIIKEYLENAENKSILFQNVPKSENFQYKVEIIQQDMSLEEKKALVDPFIARQGEIFE